MTGKSDEVVLYTGFSAEMEKFARDKWAASAEKLSVSNTWIAEKLVSGSKAPYHKIPGTKKLETVVTRKVLDRMQALGGKETRNDIATIAAKRLKKRLKTASIEMEKEAVFSAVGRGLATGASKLLGLGAKATKVAPLTAPTRQAASLTTKAKGALNTKFTDAQNMLHRGYMSGAKSLGGPENMNRAIGIGAVGLGAGAIGGAALSRKR